MSETPFRNFKKAITVSTLNANLSGYAYRREQELAKIADKQLIKEWQYSHIADVYCRYPHLFKPYKTKIHHQRVKQLGSEDYLQALCQELQNRNLLDIADNSFALSFVTQISSINPSQP